MRAELSHSREIVSLGWGDGSFSQSSACLAPTKPEQDPQNPRVKRQAGPAREFCGKKYPPHLSLTSGPCMIKGKYLVPKVVL